MGTIQAEIRSYDARRFAVRHHPGTEETIEETRRPLYAYLLMQELVGGPPVLRFHPEKEGVDVLIGATCGFDGDDMVRVELLPAGDYAVVHYEGPRSGLGAFREQVRTWAKGEGLEWDGPLLQVHLMDEIEGVTEQEMQLLVRTKKD